MSYRIGSFNMRNLGFSAIGENNKRNLRKIAEIIRNEKFDVVALQEVLSEGKAFTYEKENTKKNILWELGGEREWGFEWADANSKASDKRGEGYAFLWNKRRLRLATAKLEDGTIREFKPQMLNNIKSKIMQRYPYYARFTPQGVLGGTNFEIRLICIHTHYGKDTSADRSIRQNELDIVMKEIYPQISDKIYKNDMPHYTIILGDYNAELWRPWRDENRNKENAELKAKGKSTPPKPMCIPDEVVVDSSKWGKTIIVKTVQDKLTTLKSSNDSQPESDHLEAESHSNEPGVISACNADFENMNLRTKIAAKYTNEDCRKMFLEEASDNKNCYSHNYDHFSFEETRFEGVKWNVKRIDAVSEYCGNNSEEYIKTISDHVPIMMEIELR